MISNKIMKLNRYDDLEVYRCACDCNSINHDLFISVELNTPVNLISLVFNVNVGFNADYYCQGISRKIEKLFHNITCRVKNCFKLLFTGYIEMEAEFIMKDEESIKDFLEAINDSMIRLKKDTENGNVVESR